MQSSTIIILFALVYKQYNTLYLKRNKMFTVVVLLRIFQTSINPYRPCIMTCVSYVTEHVLASLVADCYLE